MKSRDRSIRLGAFAAACLVLLVGLPVPKAGATRLSPQGGRANYTNPAGYLQRTPNDTVPPVSVPGTRESLGCGTTTFDNGSFDNVNGLSSELNTVVSDARTADDVTFANQATICEITAQLYCTVVPPTSIVEIYADSGGNGPVNAAPIASYTATSAVQIGTGFGLPIIEFTYPVPSLVLAPGKYWICAIVTGMGSGRGFFCNSKFGVISGQSGYFKSSFFAQPVWVPVSTQNQNSDFAFTVLYSDAIPFDGCCLNDALTNPSTFRSVVANETPGNPLYGYWEYYNAPTAETFSGTASFVAYRPGLSLVMRDRDDPLVWMYHDHDYVRDVCKVQVTDRATGRQFTLRDSRASLSNCTAPEQ